MDKKSLPYEQRKKNVIEAIEIASKENDIECVPVLQPGLQDLKATVAFVDMQDPIQRKKFGLGQENSSSGILTN